MTTKFLKAAFLKVRHEPWVLVGVVIAAINSASGGSWQGYVAAVGAALQRFFFTPAY